MKITAKELAANLRLMLGAVPSRPTMPILSHVFVSVENDVLNLTSTDLEKFISVSNPCKTELGESWNTTVPARLFSDLIAKMPEETIDLSIAGNEIVISCGENDTSIKTIDFKEFPLLPGLPENDPIEIKASNLQVAITSTMYAASTDASRPILQNVYLDFSDNLTLVAADGFRLAIFETEHKSGFPNVLVPFATCIELVKILSKHLDNNVKIYSDNRRAFFVLPDIMLIAQVSFGNFVDYTKLMPKDNQVTVKCDTTELKRMVELVTVIADKEEGVIKITFNDDSLDLYASAIDIGETNRDVKAQVTGEKYATAINGQFLLHVLNTITWKDVILEQDGPKEPLAIYPDQQKMKPFAVIMPMQIR